MMMRCRQYLTAVHVSHEKLKDARFYVPDEYHRVLEKQDDQMQNRVIISLPLPGRANNINIIIFLYSIFMPIPFIQVCIRIEDHLVGGDRGKERAKVRRTSR